MNYKKSIWRVFLLITLMSSQSAIAQNVADFYRHNAQKLSLLKSEIDSITIERQTISGDYHQLIWTADSVYRTSLVDGDSVAFREVALPDVYYLTENLNGWSRMWLARNGSLLAVKDRDGEEEAPEHVAIFVPDSTGQRADFTFITFQADGSLKSVYVNGNLLTVRRIYDGMVDVTVVLSDTLTYSCDSIPLPDNTPSIGEARKLSWTRNNIWRNVSAVGKIITGAAEFFAGGTAAVLSLPAGLLGGMSAAYGLNDMRDGLNKVLDGLKMLNNSASAEIVDLKRVAEDTSENLISWLTGELGERFKKAEKPLDAVSVIADVFNYAMDYIDEVYGWTLTLEDLEEYYSNGLITIGHKLKDKSALIKGFVDPGISNTMYGTAISHTYGIALYEKGTSNYQIGSFDNQGSGHFEYEFNGLTSGTTYHYRLFYTDNDNHVTAYSDEEMFTMPLVVTGDATPIDGTDLIKYRITGSVKGTNSAQGSAYVYIIYSSDSDNPQHGIHSEFYTGQNTDGDFSVELPNIDPTKTYHYRTCLTLDDEDFYGETKVFGLNKPMGLTYDKIEEFSTSEGIVYVNYEIKTHFRPNELQSALGVVLYQDGEPISRYPMKMVESGNERDVYAGNIVLGVERTDFELNYANHRATTKNLDIALCVNMEINGELVGIVFDEDKKSFTIVYDQAPEIKFLRANVTGPEFYTDDDGNENAVSTYSYDVNITGAFWMTNAVFKSKGKGWKGSSSNIPFSVLSDNELPGMSGLLTVVDYKHTESDMKLSSYFDIMLANGNIIKSSNYLEWENNGQYITGVHIVSGSFSSTRQMAQPSNAEKTNYPHIVIQDTPSSIDSAKLPEQWQKIPTLSILKNKR